MNELIRKGERSAKDIPTDIVTRLNRGEIETANLVEWLAVDQRILLENLLKQDKRKGFITPVLSELPNLKQTVNTVNKAIGINY
jgi:hypothetical protein